MLDAFRMLHDAHPNTRLVFVGEGPLKSQMSVRIAEYGLESHVQFELRYDIPSECARLLHARETDLGLIPSIEYLRGPAPYRIVPGPAVTSRGPVASVAI